MAKFFDESTDRPTLNFGSKLPFSSESANENSSEFKNKWEIAFDSVTSASSKSLTKMGLSKQDLDRALSLQTAKLTANQERLSAQIMSIKVELDNTKQKIDELTKDIVGNKSALLDMDEKVDTLRNEIENEVLAKIRIANQIWIGNVENLDDAKEMIRRASDDQIKPMTLRAIEGKQGLQKGKTLGCIAEFNNFEEKMAILKGSSKVLKSDNPKKIYFKANQTPTERRQDKALKAEVANLREALTDTDKEFPVIRNGKIVFRKKTPSK